MTVTADDLDAAISSVVSALRPAASRDWSVRAGTLDWDCWHTAEHIGDCLLSYAAQLAARPTARYVRFLASADKDATPAEVLEFAEAGGRILVAAVRTAPAHVRAYHPTGLADPEGFAAMGCVEALLHGHDIARDSAFPSARTAIRAVPCSPGCSRTRQMTWPTRTHGKPCNGQPAAPACPVISNSGAGAGTVPRLTK